ncbi:helix-turn-helix transcriptional regulator [Arthrobacter sp. APC 3897]|uniref:helix-turn-helix transcriptional regulator n=1 Tax=Arthrobacter sp. APC 3897 TaxID=3035204 RepID=UPI0025B3488C|nr:helix-turn-helix transcriptional regulator [Arthrobacter sp. APC 3897]MDN3482477.1 helix-turn-helix transcriptional regulator [Arthrobacter sp. APC 3897]
MRNRVREFRSNRGWSQQQLADELGVSRQTVISIERGRFDPSLPLAFRLAALFGSAIEDLFIPDDRSSTVARASEEPARPGNEG